MHTCEVKPPSVGSVQWPPQTGTPLPGAARAWYEQRKLKWILGRKGHGREWMRVFHVSPEDQEIAWEAIADAMPESVIKEVRESPYGVTCGVEVELTINDRSAPILVSWHYAAEIAAPRLVTAYPIP